MGDKKSTTNGVKVLTKKDFTKKEAGINNEFFSQLFNKPVKDFDVREEKKGFGFRSLQYSFELDFKDGEKSCIWAKDYFRWGTNTHMSGEHKNDVDLDENEISFLKLLTSQRGFAPTFYKEHEFSEGGNTHKIIFMEKFQSDLETLLSADYKLTDEDIFKIIDIYLVDTSLITDFFKATTAKGTEKVYKYDHDLLEADLNSFMQSLLRYAFKNDVDEVVSWCDKNNYSLIVDALHRFEDKISGDSSVAHTLSNNPDNGLVLLTNLLPSHVLVNPAALSKSEYSYSDIFKIREGKLKEGHPYGGIAITDWDKVGFAPLALGLATLLNHTSLVKRLNAAERQKLVDSCIDHITAQYLRLKHNRDIPAGDKMLTEYKRVFNKQYNAASVYAILRNMSFITELAQRFPERMNELEKINPLYSRSSFLISNIEALLSLENANHYISYLKDGMKEIRKNLPLQEIQKKAVNF